MSLPLPYDGLSPLFYPIPFPIFSPPLPFILSPSLLSPRLPFLFLPVYWDVGPFNPAIGAGELSPTGTAADEPEHQLKSSLVHFSLKICVFGGNNVNEWMNEWMTKTYNVRSCRTKVESEARAVAGRAKGGYTLRVVRDVRWVFSRRLKVSNVLMIS